MKILASNGFLITSLISRHTCKFVGTLTSGEAGANNKADAGFTSSMAFIVLLLAAVLVPSSTAFAQTTSDTIITRSVVAESGDTLRSIARKEFGKSGLSSMLASFNGMKESDPIAPGQVIRIPLFTPVERQFATVIFAKGDVTKNDEPLERDDKVYLQELIKTGENGFASLQFGSGSVFNLQPLTHAKLARLNCLETDDSCLISLDSPQGEVSSDVKRRDGQPTEFTINTPYASAAVRGTFFELNAVTTNIIVGVTEGEVLLQAGANDLPLDEGFGSVASENAPPMDPVALLPAPVYRYIPKRAAKGDQVSWWALSDVDQYLVNLSADEGGMDVIGKFNEQEGVFSLVEDIDAGEYFMNVRGIDSNGIKGYKSPTKLVVAAIDDSVNPVDTAVSRQGNEFLVQVIDPPTEAPGYEIQVSTNETFSDPLSVDVSTPGTAIFRLESDKIYARARILIEPEKVSAFGGVAESN